MKEYFLIYELIANCDAVFFLRMKTLSDRTQTDHAGMQKRHHGSVIAMLLIYLLNL